MLREQNKVGAPVNELDLAVRAVSINTTSKLTYDDLQQFRLLLKSTFPEVTAGTGKNEKLAEKIRVILKKQMQF